MKAVIASLKKDNFWIFLLVTGIFMVLGTTESAFAANDKTAQFRSFVSDPIFKGAIDLTLLILAGYKWFEYIANFQPQNAFMAALTPAAITFFAFQWVQVLQWLGIG
jgi:hypothetical protein